MSSRRPKKRPCQPNRSLTCSIGQNDGYSDGASAGRPQECWTDLSFAMPVQMVSANRSASGPSVFRDSKLAETDASRSAASITRSASLSLAPFSKASKLCVKSSGMGKIPSRGDRRNHPAQRQERCWTRIGSGVCPIVGRQWHDPTEPPDSQGMMQRFSSSNG
jgi:hypothetical protein